MSRPDRYIFVFIIKYSHYYITTYVSSLKWMWFLIELYHFREEYFKLRIDRLLHRYYGQAEFVSVIARTPAISRGISKHLPEKLAHCTLWTGTLCLGCAECLRSVLESTGRALPRVLQPKRNVSLWTKLTTKQQQCINIPLCASASTDVSESSWPPPPFMKITLCWRQSGGKPGEARNRRNWILWEGLLYLSLKLSICGSNYVYKERKVILALGGMISS